MPRRCVRHLRSWVCGLAVGRLDAKRRSCPTSEATLTSWLTSGTTGALLPRSRAHRRGRRSKSPTRPLVKWFVPWVACHQIGTFTVRSWFMGKPSRFTWSRCTPLRSSEFLGSHCRTPSPAIAGCSALRHSREQARTAEAPPDRRVHQRPGGSTCCGRQASRRGRRTAAGQAQQLCRQAHCRGEGTCQPEGREGQGRRRAPHGRG